MIRISDIETFFKDYDFSYNQLVLSECETITNLKKYVDTNINLLKSNSGKKTYKPYFDRLLKVYKLLKN